MSAAEKIVESAVAHRHSFDSLSPLQRHVLVHGLKAVLDNSKTDEEFEEATALSALLADDEAPEQKQFTDAMDGKPIEGLPEPMPCPFCDFDEWTAIVTVDACTTPRGIKCEASYHVQCDGCLAEGSPQASKLEAAQHWNKAARKVDYSIIEALDSVNLLLTHTSDALLLATSTLREDGIAEDAPVAACLESIQEAKLEPAREQLDAVMQKLSSPTLAMTG